jgi:hypothetical protein
MKAEQLSSELVSSKLPIWSVSIAVAGLLVGVALTVYVRAPSQPSALVLSICRPASPALRRIDSDFGIRFLVLDPEHTVHHWSRDMPPGTLHVVAFKNRDASMLIGHDDDLFARLRVAFPVFSERVEQRDVRDPSGQVVGKDRWGYLHGGDRWRYVSFDRGDAVGYEPQNSRNAALFDQVISSACVPTRPSANQ